jgi:hypothetical protein
VLRESSPPFDDRSPCGLALKEWAVVEAALAEGRQSILVRAGGVADPAGRFGFPRRRFWIFPTRFHEAPDSLVATARDLVEKATAEAAADGASACRRLSLLADLVAVAWVADPDAVRRLTGLHVFSEETVAKRFAYREPGLAVALLRVWRRTPPHRIVETPAMAGCHSWVELPEALACDPAEPVLGDAAFERIREAWAERVGLGGV